MDRRISFPYEDQRFFLNNSIGVEERTERKEAGEEKQRITLGPKTGGRTIDTRHDTRYIAEKLPERKLQSMLPVRGTYTSRTAFFPIRIKRAKLRSIVIDYRNRILGSDSGISSFHKTPGISRQVVLTTIGQI